MKVSIIIDYIEDHPKGKVIMKDNLGKLLIKKYNSAAKEVRIRVRYFENQQIRQSSRRSFQNSKYLVK